MEFQGKSWNGFQQQSGVSFVVKVSLVVMLALLCLGISMGVNTREAHAQSNATQQTHVTHTANVSNMPPTGSYNWFPYPWCTYWADARYHQMHGVYVPWSTNSNAWQWTARAYQFGWNVSSRPTVGAIINLQPWVQGAYGLGHVGVVEQILRDGSVIASNMSWGSNPYAVVYWHFYPGNGVTFITW